MVVVSCRNFTARPYCYFEVTPQIQLLQPQSLKRPTPSVFCTASGRAAAVYEKLRWSREGCSRSLDVEAGGAPAAASRGGLSSRERAYKASRGDFSSREPGARRRVVIPVLPVVSQSPPCPPTAPRWHGGALTVASQPSSLPGVRRPGSFAGGVWAPREPLF